MTIDWNTLPREPQEFEFAYTWRDVVLYALGIGAQVGELPFLYENTPGGLQVFPSFASKASGELFLDLSRQVEGFRFLHGEQGVRLHRPIPPEGKIIAISRIADVYDKGKAAVIRFLTEGRTEDGAPLFDVEHTAFYVGAGGFGGDPGPKAVSLPPPEGVAPDFSVVYPIPENQAALYRLSGDLNPLHLDPEFARRGGFDRPILHGLCTYGYATRAILHGLCGGDVRLFKEFKARFSGTVYPGETLTTEGWQESAGRYIIRARTERTVVLSNAYAEVKI
jgi:acyl dehydratase